MPTDYDEDEPTHTRSDEKRCIDLVRLALAFESQKKPLKREDIAKKVFPYESTNGYVRPQSVNYVMDLANVKLRNVFGMELVPLPVVPRPSNSRTAEGRKKDVERVHVEEQEKPDNVYVLKSLLPDEYRRILSLHRQPEALALLFIIISIITLNGCDMSEQDLLSTLESIGGYSSLDAQLEAFKKQRYLMAYKKKTDDGDVPMFAVGARAKVEMPAEVLAEFAVEMTRMTEQTGMESNIRKAFDLFSKK